MLGRCLPRGGGWAQCDHVGAIIVDRPVVGLDSNPPGTPEVAPFHFSVARDDACANWTYDWDFGDGWHSVEEAPDHNYTTPGYKTVTVHVTNDCGDSCTKETTVVVIGGPFTVLVEGRDGATPPQKGYGTEDGKFWYLLRYCTENADGEFDQRPNRAKFTVAYAQPATVSYWWSAVGPADIASEYQPFNGTSGATMTKFEATEASSSLGDIHCYLTYEIEFNGLGYGCADDSDAIPRAGGQPDPDFRRATSHRPSRTVPASTSAFIHHGPPYCGCTRKYKYKVLDQFLQNQMCSGVKIQEFFPNLPTESCGLPGFNFKQNCPSGVHWTTDGDGVFNDWDWIGYRCLLPNCFQYMNGQGQPAVVPFTHMYYGGTKRCEPLTGCLIGSYVLTMWTDYQTHE